jgi:hypothetical protein
MKTMKNGKCLLYAAALMLGCARGNDSPELQAAWAQVAAKQAADKAAAEAQVAATVAPADVTAPAAPAADEAPEPALSEKTSVERAALVVAGSAVAKGLLLREWRPARIRRLAGERAKSNPACANYDSVLVEYDHQRDALNVDRETCWYEGSSEEANLRYQAAYMAGIAAARLASPAAQRADEDDEDARWMLTTICLEKAGYAYETACKDPLQTYPDGSLPEGITTGLQDEIRAASRGAARCAEALVKANEPAIRALAAQVAPGLRESAVANWTHTGNPLPDMFGFNVAGELKKFRRATRLKMTVPERSRDKQLPAYCSLPR